MPPSIKRFLCPAGDLLRIGGNNIAFCICAFHRLCDPRVNTGPFRCCRRHRLTSQLIGTEKQFRNAVFIPGVDAYAGRLARSHVDRFGPYLADSPSRPPLRPRTGNQLRLDACPLGCRLPQAKLKLSIGQFPPRVQTPEFRFVIIQPFQLHPVLRRHAVVKERLLVGQVLIGQTAPHLELRLRPLHGELLLGFCHRRLKLPLQSALPTLETLLGGKGLKAIELVHGVLLGIEVLLLCGQDLPPYKVIIALLVLKGPLPLVLHYSHGQPVLIGDEGQVLPASLQVLPACLQEQLGPDLELLKLLLATGQLLAKRLLFAAQAKLLGGQATLELLLAKLPGQTDFLQLILALLLLGLPGPDIEGRLAQKSQIWLMRYYNRHDLPHFLFALGLFWFTMLWERRISMKSLAAIVIVFILCVTVLIFGLFIWPTPYRYETIKVRHRNNPMNRDVVYKINRFTGHSEPVIDSSPFPLDNLTVKQPSR